MPRDTNPVVVITDSTMTPQQDIAGNPTTGSGLTGTNSSSTTPTPSPPAQETGNTNPTPMLITPEVEPPHRPVGSGSSVVVEPELGTPIVRDEPTPINVGGIQAPLKDEKPTNNPIKNLVNSLPSFLGGGGGGAGAEDTTKTNAPKKPNYLLYGGILLAIIIAYKVFSKKK
jgi:hypothetical protein